MRILLLIVFLFNCGISPGAVPPPVQKTLDAFNTFNGIPREKIYLHTDRDVYRAGEDIYFRAYLLDAATNMPAIRSRYVYVELMNQQDSVLRRVKL